MKLIPIQYHYLQYPAGINPDLEEIAGDFDITQIKSKLYNTPQDYKFSLHTEYSAGKRELNSSFIAKYQEIYNHVYQTKNGKIPKLWVSKKWAEEFALFIIDILNGAKPKIIEIHPPTTRDISFNTFLDYYEIFKDTLKKNGLTIGEGEEETMILLENRNGWNNRQFLLTYIWDFLKLSDLIDKRESDLRLILDLPQLLNQYAENGKKYKCDRENLKSLLEKINEFKHNVKAIHLWGKYGRDAHAGDMNDFFDYNQELKELFFNKIYKIFKDGHNLYFIPEINNDTDCKSKKECLKNIVTDLINAGFKFENTKIAEILEKYDKKAEKKNYYKLYKNAKLENLQTCLICLINNKNGNILELGFGAGREIEFLLKKGYKNIYGIEGSEKFLELVKKELKNENKYKNIADNLYYSVLPEINIPKDIKFDLIFSTFVWNHLPEIMYERTVKNIMNLLKSNGKVLIAYSLDNNENQEIVRYNINEEYLIELFEKYGMELSKKEKMKGSYKIDDNEISENSFDFKVLVFNKKKN